MDAGITPKVMNIGFRQQALGDSVATLPAIKQALLLYPEISFHIWPPDYICQLVALALGQYPNALVRPASTIMQAADLDAPTVFNKYKGDHYHTTLKKDLVNYGFRTILDQDPPSGDVRDYVQLTPVPHKYKLPEPYAVLTLNYTSNTRVMPAQAAQRIIGHLLARGITPVILGNHAAPTGTGTLESKRPQVDLAGCVDLCDQTTILEAHAILAKAQVVIGVDNGLLHLAAMTNAPIAAGFTNVDPATRTPQRHGSPGWRWEPVTVAAKPACAPCQTKWHYCYGVKFTECHYKHLACAQFTGEEFISAIDKLVPKA